MSTARFWSSAQQPKARTGSRRPLGLRRSFSVDLPPLRPCELFQNTLSAYLIEDRSVDESSDDHSIVAEKWPIRRG